MRIFKVISVSCLMALLLTLGWGDEAKPNLRDQIIEQIGNAKTSIDVVVYEIGSQPIADALSDAKDRGVQVRVILDEERSFVYSKAERFLVDQGVALRKVSIHQWKLLHDKFILFDNTLAATPSYNRTDDSDPQDAGGEVFVTQKALVRQLGSEFHKVWDAAKPAE